MTENIKMKIAEWYASNDAILTVSEKESLINLIDQLLAERTEQCAQTCLDVAADHIKSGEPLTGLIYPMAQKCAKKNCETSASILADSMKRLDQSARIATLHEWQAQDQKTIQELNASNNALSEKIAQLEKEKHELTQKADYCILCSCDSCRLRYERERAASRKA